MKSEVRAPSLEWEKRLGFPGVSILGIDEVGRVCLAGPVVAGALLLPERVDLEQDPWLKEVADSKCLSPEKREELAPRLQTWARAWAIGVAMVIVAFFSWISKVGQAVWEWYSSHSVAQ